MGAMGRSTPQPKVVGASRPSRAQEFCYVSKMSQFLHVYASYTAEMYSKNYECVIMQLAKVALFQTENAPKAFGDRAPPRPVGELTALLRTQ